jgi:hypothetical protein
MPKNTIKGPTSPEERIEEQGRKEAASRKEREAFNDFQEEEKALESAEAGCEVSQTATGKMITRHNTHKPSRSRRRRLKSAFSEGGLFDTIDAFGRQLIGLATTAVVGGVATANKISGQYNTQVDPMTSQFRVYEDQEYIYDTVLVSKEAHEKLTKESETINKILVEMATTKDPERRLELATAIEELSETYEMKLHPINRAFVHDINRVFREEQCCNQHNHAQEFRVLIYALKAEHGDLRGIKSKIADQFDNTPEEAQVSGDHLKGHAPAPALHNV